MLAQHYREGMELIYQGARQVRRRVDPDPISADDRGSSAVANVGQQMDELTFRLRAGKLTSGQVLTRPYRNLPMFVGVLLTGLAG